MPGCGRRTSARTSRPITTSRPGANVRCQAPDRTVIVGGTAGSSDNLSVTRAPAATHQNELRGTELGPTTGRSSEKYASGSTSNSESMRSSRPPKPGSQSPASLTWACRFTIDSTRSPKTPPNATATRRPIEIVPSSVSTMNAPMKAPISPPTVLFGLNGDNGRRGQAEAAQPLSSAPGCDIGGRRGEAHQKRVLPQHHQVRQRPADPHRTERGERGAPAAVLDVAAEHRWQRAQPARRSARDSTATGAARPPADTARPGQQQTGV